MDVPKGKRIAAILGRPGVPQETGERFRTTLYLDKKKFEWFQEFCKSKGTTPSEFIASYIADLKDEFDRATITP